MKLGIIGLPGSGKSTIFCALTRHTGEAGNRGENRISTITVPDTRVNILSEMYKPRKTIFARIEYFLPGRQSASPGKDNDPGSLNKIRDCDAIIHVVRNFSGYGLKEPSPVNDFTKMNQELILSDFIVAEKRMERIENDRHRSKTVDNEEVKLLKQCLKHLENNTPVRQDPDLAAAHALKGFAFVSAKPMLVLFNNEDEDTEMPEKQSGLSGEECMVIRGKLEQELAQMTDEEAVDFLSEFNITASAMDRVIKRSYELLGLISFFTVGEDEVRAWTIKKNTSAVDAAEVIHSDIKRGFIRAEVVAYEDLTGAGSYHEARKKGSVRLEGKSYNVKDGDIINFRFNV